MSHNPETLRQMDDAHLLAVASAEIDDLTSTALEVELLARLEEKLRIEAECSPMALLLDEYEEDIDGVRAVIEAHPARCEEQAAMLRQLDGFGITSAQDLARLLDWVFAFRALANAAHHNFNELTILAKAAIKEKK